MRNPFFFFLFFLVWLKCHFFGSLRFQHNQVKHLHDISSVNVLILGTGRPVHMGVRVRYGNSFGGTRICYASAQMSWLKQHMGDKNSYASYCIHGLAARGFPLTAHTVLRNSFLVNISNKMVKFICVLGNLTKWEDLKCVSVIKSPVSCQRAALLQLCVQ